MKDEHQQTESEQASLDHVLDRDERQKQAVPIKRSQFTRDPTSTNYQSETQNKPQKSLLELVEEVSA